ncbi:hypothetical protein ACEWY4_010716 [Coilia grayii]|uniref:Aquaporin-9 n=1 Tax=Coilia grayii TaxID=363190 RepID=A0ABD1K2N8_9TELE
MTRQCALKHGIFKEFLAELLGTFVLVLFGCGSVAQTVLSRNTLGENLTIHIGFSTGLMMGVYVSGGISGGHLNPAVSLAMVILGKLKIYKFPIYVLAQMLGAFAGAAAVFGLYYDAFMDFTSGILSVTGINATAHIFASYPGRHLSILNGIIDQVIGTGMLVLCILAITDGKNIGAPRGAEPVAVGLALLAISVSMGLNCGYPINPARDLGPRLFTFAAGWGLEVFSTADNWWWIPVAGPMAGGVVGAVVYFLFVKMHHPHSQKPHEEQQEEEEEEEEEDESLKDKEQLFPQPVNERPFESDFDGVFSKSYDLYDNLAEKC